MASGGLPKGFSFKKRKKHKAKKFNIGAQLAKESAPVKIEKPEEDKKIDEEHNNNEWQEIKQTNTGNSFASNFGLIQTIEEKKKRPQEGAVARNERKKGREVLRKVINAAPKRVPEKVEQAPVRTGWRFRMKQKKEFKITEGDFPSMNPNAAVAADTAKPTKQNSVWAAKSTTPSKPEPTEEKKPAESDASTAELQIETTPKESAETPPKSESSDSLKEEIKKKPNKFKKMKKKKKKKKKEKELANKDEITPQSNNASEAVPLPIAATSPPDAEQPGKVQQKDGDAPAEEAKPKKVNKFKKKKKKKKKKEGDDA